MNVDGTLSNPHPGQDGDWITTSYQQTAVNPAAHPVADPAGAGFVVAPAPRLVSNLISEQSADNPAAVAAPVAATAVPGTGYQPPTIPTRRAGTTLGIALSDADVNNVPLPATDAYGNFIRGAHGYVQLVVRDSDGTTRLVEGDPANPISTANAARTGVAFIDDKNHNASPFDDYGHLLVADVPTPILPLPAFELGHRLPPAGGWAMPRLGALQLFST